MLSNMRSLVRTCNEKYVNMLSHPNGVQITYNAVRIDKKKVFDAPLVFSTQHVLPRRVGSFTNQEVAVDTQQILHLRNVFVS